MVDNHVGPKNSRNIAGFTYTNKAAARGTSTGGGSEYHDQNQRLTFKEQDRLLPIANVGRIMKQILPSNAKISKEAKETMQECVSEFIGFVTGEASDKCRQEKRKTVNGDDICWAFGSLGFDDYFECLKRFMNKYREFEGEKANQNKASEVDYEERYHESDFGPFSFNLMEERRI